MHLRTLTLGALGPFLGTHTVDFDALMMWEHVGMLLAMLVAMLARPGEYLYGHQH